MYTFSPMMVANSLKHHCRGEVLVISTNLDIQKNHYPLDFRNRRRDEARIKNTWYNQVNPTHAYYNGSRTSKDNEDPGWNTSFKTRRTQKTTSAVEALWKTILRCYLYLLGTFPV
ncbi:hypothetical protein Tco_1525735, partial [Tanacetum coccineum]